MKPRQEQRVRAVLPVRLNREETSAPGPLAHTLDIAGAGVRLGAVREPLALGGEVILQFRLRKALYRVVWIKRLSPSGEYQAGLSSINPAHDLWGLSPAAGS